MTNKALEITNLSSNIGSFSLRDINLSIEKGTIMGLIGKNGAGKTTLIKTILEKYERKNGQVFFSRFYTLLNIYLFTLITIFSFSFILLIGYLTTYFSFDSIKLLNNFISYFKGIILSLFLFLIISSVYIPTFFIKSLGIRRLLILFQTILLKILLLIANNKFASYNVHPFLKRIGDLSSYSRILMIIMLTFIIITPISIFISYKLYRKKEILC